jgi:DNA-directed RNA polymerase subunit RPC12/RpoP
MSQPLHTGRLILTPEDPYFVPNQIDAILHRLEKIGLVGRPLENGNGYLLGDAFMQLVTFMGCSPAIRLEPDDSGEAFCHLLSKGPYPKPRLIGGKNTQPPRCNACRKRISDWQGLFQDGSLKEADRLFVCPHCNHPQDPAKLDFRQSGGCGRIFLFIENIFPQEALPSPTLLNALQQESEQQPWCYFYQQEYSAGSRRLI